MPFGAPSTPSPECQLVCGQRSRLHLVLVGGLRQESAIPTTLFQQIDALTRENRPSRIDGLWARTIVRYSKSVEHFGCLYEKLILCKSLSRVVSEKLFPGRIPNAPRPEDAPIVQLI